MYLSAFQACFVDRRQEQCGQYANNRHDDQQLNETKGLRLSGVDDGLLKSISHGFEMGATVRAKLSCAGG
jgi:hypothetical protein